MQFTYVQATGKAFSPQKREHPTLQKMKFINFFFYVCGSFFPSWIRIANPDPDTDPGTPLNPDPDAQCVCVCVGAQVHDRAAGLQPGHRGAHPHHEAQAAHRPRALCQED